jgi:hypothetical protein
MAAGASRAAFIEDDFIRLTGEIVRRFSVFHRHGDVACIKGWTAKDEPLFIKFFFGSRALSDANAEYQALARYSESMKDAKGCRCPRPVAFLQNDGIGGAILCEWTAARRGDRYFKLFMPFGFLRRKGITGVAEWLGTFHAASGVTERPLDEVLDRAGLMAELAALLGEGRELAAFKAMLAANAAGPVRCARLHGDFTPSNLFITRSEVIGFDFTAEASGPALLDAGKFLTALIWYGYFDLTKTPGQKFREDSRLFLSAHASRAGADAPEVTKAFLVKALVDLAQKLQLDMETGVKRKATKQKHLAIIRKVLQHTLAERAF